MLPCRKMCLLVINTRELGSETQHLLNLGIAGATSIFKWIASFIGNTLMEEAWKPTSSDRSCLASGQPEAQNWHRGRLCAREIGRLCTASTCIISTLIIVTMMSITNTIVACESQHHGQGRITSSASTAFSIT